MQREERGVWVDSEFKLHFEAKHIGTQKHENCISLARPVSERRRSLCRIREARDGCPLSSVSLRPSSSVHYGRTGTTAACLAATFGERRIGRGDRDRAAR